jgi:hypothetical protein
MNDNDIEKHLRQALPRCDAPEGFADRVLKRVAAEGSKPMRLPFWNWHWPVLRWAAIPALAAVVATGVGYGVYERRQQEEAMVAKQQVMLALRIAGSKLRLAKQKVKEAESAKTENRL